MSSSPSHSALPSDMPAFFREAGNQLVYLDIEPDRWRSGNLTEMDQAWSYDHYIDLENIPDGALSAPDRFVFLRALYDARLERPERDAGFLPFRIVELYQSVVTEWRMWRAETDPEKRSWDRGAHHRRRRPPRSLRDGRLAAPPHDDPLQRLVAGRSGPEGVHRGPALPRPFERYFVEAHVTQPDVSQRVERRPRSVAGSARAAVLDYLRASHATVDALYRLDRDVGFDPDGPLRPEAHDFAADRLAAGASMLAVLWRSAWDESAL